MTTASAANRSVEELAGAVGREYVCEDAERLMKCAVDGVVPQVLVSPASAEEVAAVMRIVNEHDLVVSAQGGRTRLSIGQIPERVDVVLSMERINAVESYDPGDLTICLAAGARVGNVQTLVRENRQVLPLDVATAGDATIGGVLASADFGPMKHRFGGAREFCIGVKFVTGDGRQGKGGGRVVKNVAGYDMMKLMIGSQGTLGVITSANFKLFPAPPMTRTFVAEFASIGEAIGFRSLVLRSPLSPLSLELVTPRAHEYLAPGAGERWSVLLQAGGSDAVLGRYRSELGSAVTKEYVDASEGDLWASICNFSQRLTARHANAMLVEVQLPASEVAAVVESAERVALSENFLLAGVGRFAVASMVFAFAPIAVDPPSAMQYVNAISALRAVLPRGGAAIVACCPLEVKRHVSVWGSPASDIDAMKAVKRALDPKNMLNRGRFLF